MKQTNLTESPKAGVLEDGVHLVRSLGEEVLSVPFRIERSLLEFRNELHTVVADLLLDKYVIGCEFSSIVAILCDTNWQRATNRLESLLVEQHVVLLHLRVDLLDAIETYFSSSAFFFENDCFTLVQLIRMWKTAHIPLFLWTETHGVKPPPTSRLPGMNLSVGPHILPSMSCDLSRLDFSDNKKKQTKSEHSSCMLHILSKVLPKRCQIRELGRFLTKYCAVCPRLNIVFKKMMLVSLLDLYPKRTRSKERMRGTEQCSLLPEERKSKSFKELCYICCSLDLYQPDNEQKNICDIFAAQTKTYPQIIFFWIIRELLVYQVELHPALRVTLNIHASWRDFESSFSEHSRRIRIFANNFDNILAPNALDSLVLFASTVSSRTRFNVHYREIGSLLGTADAIKNVYISQMHHWKETSLHEMREVLDATNFLAEQANMLQFLSESPDPCLNEHIARIFRSCHGCIDASSIDTQLSSLYRMSHTHYFRFFFLILEMSNDLSASIHPLPKGIWIRQTLATHEQWMITGGLPPRPHANTFVLCPGCKEPKVAVHDALEKKRKTSPHASVDVRADDINNRLVCCGSVSYKELLGAASDYRAETEPRQGVRARAKHVLCGKVTVARIHLIGNILWSDNIAYTLCVQCACIMSLCSQSMTDMMCAICRTRRSEFNTTSKCGSTGNTKVRSSKHQKENGSICALCDRFSTGDVVDRFRRQVFMYSTDSSDPLYLVSLCNLCKSVYDYHNGIRTQLRTLQEYKSICLLARSKIDLYAHSGHKRQPNGKY